MTVIVDKLGLPIEPGHYVVYGHAVSQSNSIRVGKVIRMKTWLAERYNQCHREYRITVRAVDDDYDHFKPELLSKTSCLYFPRRMLGIADDQLPPEMTELFKDVQADKKCWPCPICSEKTFNGLSAREQVGCPDCKDGCVSFDELQALEAAIAK